MTALDTFLRAWERAQPPDRLASLRSFLDRHSDVVASGVERLSRRSAPAKPRAWTGRADFEERREARIDRLNTAADRASGEARRRFEQVGKNLPEFGQPILVGHHSEKRHRRAIERSDQNMRKHIEMSDKASDLRARAEAAEDNTAISSDDPQAVEKLKARIAQLEDKVAAWKEINKAIRSKDARTKLAEMGYSEKAIETLLTKDVMGDIGIPAYRFNNTRNNILRLKKRLAGLEAASEAEIPDVYEFGGGSVTWDPDTNRIVVKHSPGMLLKEDRERRSVLMKSYGFNWGDSYRGFVRQANMSAFLRGKDALESLVKDHENATKVRDSIAAAESSGLQGWDMPRRYILRVEPDLYTVIVWRKPEMPQPADLRRARDVYRNMLMGDEKADENAWPVWDGPAGEWTTLGQLAPTPIPELVELNDGRWISKDEARERYHRQNAAIRNGVPFDPTGDYGVKPKTYPPPSTSESLPRIDDDWEQLFLRPEYVNRIVRSEMADVVARAMQAGAVPPFDYQGAGMTSIVFCDSSGTGWKVRRPGRPEATLAEEAEWLTTAAQVPGVREQVARIVRYHPEEGAIERECVQGRPGGWSQGRWLSDVHSALNDRMMQHGWTSPEFKEDSYIVRDDGSAILVDASMPQRVGARLVQYILDILNGTRPRGMYESNEDLAFLVRRERGDTIPAEEADRVLARLTNPGISTLARSLEASEPLPAWRPQGTQLITREPGQRDRWRVTRFDEQMEPLGHFGPETFPQVIERASQDGDLREFRPLTLSERLPFARRR